MVNCVKLRESESLQVVTLNSRTGTLVSTRWLYFLQRFQPLYRIA